MLSPVRSTLESVARTHLAKLDRRAALETANGITADGRSSDRIMGTASFGSWRCSVSIVVLHNACAGLAEWGRRPFSVLRAVLSAALE